MFFSKKKAAKQPSVKKCKECLAEIDAEAKKCKFCGSKQPKDYKRFAVGCLALFIVGIIGAAIEGNSSETTSNRNINNSTNTKNQLEEISDTEACVISRNFIKPILKSPKTADFPMFDCVAVESEENVWVVNSYVDAQNSFGAMIRSYYMVKLQYTGGNSLDSRNWELLDVSIE